MPITDAAEVSELSPKTFARFAQFITGELGIKMPESKLSMVQSRLLRRVRELQLKSVEQYSEYFFTSSNAEEREHFINAITTNKTDFFREAEHFDFLTRISSSRHSTALAGYRPGSRLKVWSAGCSSGEEPYTLAMVLSEYELQHPGFDFAILGTDVSTRVLDLARSGIYQESQTAGAAGASKEIPPARPRQVAMPGAGSPGTPPKGDVPPAQLHVSGLRQSGTCSIWCSSATS